MKIEIKSSIDGSIIFSTEAESLKEAVEKAIEANANLRYADLSKRYIQIRNIESSLHRC